MKFESGIGQEQRSASYGDVLLWERLEREMDTQMILDENSCPLRRQQILVRLAGYDPCDAFFLYLLLPPLKHVITFPVAHDIHQTNPPLVRANTRADLLRSSVFPHGSSAPESAASDRSTHWW